MVFSPGISRALWHTGRKVRGQPAHGSRVYTSRRQGLFSEHHKRFFKIRTQATITLFNSERYFSCGGKRLYCIAQYKGQQLSRVCQEARDYNQKSVTSRSAMLICSGCLLCRPSMTYRRPTCSQDVCRANQWRGGEGGFLRLLLSVTSRTDVMGMTQKSKTGDISLKAPVRGQLHQSNSYEDRRDKFYMIII